MQAIVNDLVSQFTRQGSGKTLLFLHGWGDDSSTFKALLPTLTLKYDCLVPDLPGFGKTEPPKEPWNLDNYVLFIEAFLKKLGIENLYGIIAHSNGAAVAIRGFGIGNLSPEKLVLLGAAGLRDGGTGRRMTFKAAAKVGKVLTFWLPRSHKRALQKKLYGASGSDMLVVPELKETFKRTVRQDVQEDAKRITSPTLLIYGDDDTATPVGDGKRFMGLIQDARLETLKGSHFIHQEQPEAVSRLITEFLK